MNSQTSAAIEEHPVTYDVRLLFEQRRLPIPLYDAEHQRAQRVSLYGPCRLKLCPLHREVFCA